MLLFVLVYTVYLHYSHEQKTIIQIIRWSSFLSERNILHKSVSQHILGLPNPQKIHSVVIFSLSCHSNPLWLSKKIWKCMLEWIGSNDVQTPKFLKISNFVFFLFSLHLLTLIVVHRTFSFMLYELNSVLLLSKTLTWCNSYSEHQHHTIIPWRGMKPPTDNQHTSAHYPNRHSF